MCVCMFVCESGHVGLSMCVYVCACGVYVCVRVNIRVCVCVCVCLEMQSASPSRGAEGVGARLPFCPGLMSRWGHMVQARPADQPYHIICPLGMLGDRPVGT